MAYLEDDDDFVVVIRLFPVNTRLCFLKVHFEGGQGWVKSTRVRDIFVYLVFNLAGKILFHFSPFKSYYYLLKISLHPTLLRDDIS